MEKIESIGQLHTRYCVAINGATHCGRTWLTFTYDPGLLSPEDIHRLIEMYREQLALANRELAADERELAADELGLNADRAKIGKSTQTVSG